MLRVPANCRTRTELVSNALLRPWKKLTEAVTLGAFGYAEVLPRLKAELDQLLASGAA